MSRPPQAMAADANFVEDDLEFIEVYNPTSSDREFDRLAVARRRGLRF